MNSFTVSHTNTFTVTHARHIAAKVATDLKRVQRFYNHPSNERIEQFEKEIVELLKGGYIDHVTFGFQRNDNWIEPTLRYTAKELASDQGFGDDPGKIVPGKDVSGASFYSYLVYSPAWSALSSSQKADVEKQLPFSRTTANEPGINGVLVPDRTYSAGGKALDRYSVRSY